MEFESQEIFEIGSFNTPGASWAWNQNMTEEMMNSYNSVPNCHSDMFYHHHHHQHQVHQHALQQQALQSTHQNNTPQYEYFEHHAYYHALHHQQQQHQQVDHHHLQQDASQTSQNYDPSYDNAAMQNSVESCDSMIDDMPNYQQLFGSQSILDASQFSTSHNNNNLNNNNNNMMKDQENQPKPCFFCTVCNMKFSRLYHLKRHFDSITHKSTVKENNIEDPAENLLNFYKQPKEFQKYECQMCSKKYKNKISLKRHLNVHNGLKNVLWCQFNTTRRVNTTTEAGVSNCCGIDCSAS